MPVAGRHRRPFQRFQFCDGPGVVLPKHERDRLALARLQLAARIVGLTIEL